MKVNYNDITVDCEIEETDIAYKIYSDSKDIPKEIIIDKFLSDFQEIYKSRKLKIEVYYRNN